MPDSVADPGGKAKPNARPAVVLGYSLASAVYLGWHVFVIARAPRTWASLFSLAVLFVAVIMLVAAGRVLHLLAATIDRRSEADAQEGWWLASDVSPMVVIIIPTYDESPEIVERAVVGAQGQDYPLCIVCLADDGARPAIRGLAEARGVMYVSRVHGAHAKAGNLNHAVAGIAEGPLPPEFLAVVDADFVLQPGFVRRTLALMRDRSVGLVQTPQAFYNADNFQTAAGAEQALPDALRFAYDVLQPSRDARGMAFCSGTSFLIRLEALARIGGFPTGVLLEDILTSIRLKEAGYRSVYLDEHLSFGLATEGLGEFLVQRRRWWRGYGQMVRQTLLGDDRRALRRRLLRAEPYARGFFVLIAYWFLVLVPAFSAWTGISPVPASATAFATAAVAPLLIYRAFVTVVSRCTYIPIVTEAAFLVGGPALALAWLRGVGGSSPAPFIVTPKGADHSRARVHWAQFVPIAATGLLVVSGIVRSAITGRGLPLGTVMTIWAIYSVAVSAVAAVFCIDRRQKRREPRFATQAVVRIRRGEEEAEGVLVDMSVRGARAIVGLDLARGERIALAVPPVGWVAAQVVDVDRRRGVHLATEPDLRTRALLVRTLYSGTYVEPMRSGRPSSVAVALLRTYAGAVAALPGVLSSLGRRALARSGDAPQSRSPGDG